MKLLSRIAWLWAVLLALCVPAFAAETDFDMEEGGFYNIVLLMDKSGSMNFTDGQRNAVNEAKMFVHSLYTGVQNKEAVGAEVEINLEILPFSKETEPGTYFIGLASPEAVGEAMNTIDAIRYDPEGTGATDLGKAVSAAVTHLVTRQDNTHTGLVVLFTDGYTEYLSSEPNKAELEANSAALLQESLAEARRNGYEIYVIGLNQLDNNGQERIKPKGRAEIMRIANETQSGNGLVSLEEGEINPNGKPGKNYVITNSLRAIQNFYIRLFANLMRSARPLAIEPSTDQPDPSQTYFDIPISTNRISCCNIYVTSEGTIGDVGIFSPSGEYLSSSDSRVSIKEDSGGKYKILSLWSPEMGNWRLRVTAPQDAPFLVQCVEISGIKIRTTPLSIQNGEAEVEVRAFYGNEELTEDFYRNIENLNQANSGAGFVAVAEDPTQTPHLLAYNPDRNALTTKIPVPESGQYTLYTQLTPGVTENKVSKRVWEADLTAPPVPEPEPIPEPEPEPTPEPEPEPDPNPTPEPDPEPNPNPEPEDDSTEKKKFTWSPMYLLVIIPFLLALVAAIVAVIVSSSKKKRRVQVFDKLNSGPHPDPASNSSSVLDASTVDATVGVYDSRTSAGGASTHQTQGVNLRK